MLLNASSTAATQICNPVAAVRLEISTRVELQHSSPEVSASQRAHISRPYCSLAADPLGASPAAAADSAAAMLSRRAAAASSDRPAPPSASAPACPQRSPEHDLLPLDVTAASGA